MICIKDHPEKDHRAPTSKSIQPLTRPKVIYDITEEELTSSIEYDIKYKNQEEIESKSSGHHHVPRHQIVYNTFGQPHLECLEDIPSENWDHHWERYPEEEWHRGPHHHDCWDHEQHQDWHQRSGKEKIIKIGIIE